MKQKKQIFLRRLPLSRFLAKTRKVNKISKKNFSKICHSKSTLNFNVLPLMYKMNALVISGVRSQVEILSEELQCSDQLCMYVCNLDESKLNTTNMIFVGMMAFVGVLTFARMITSVGIITCVGVMPPVSVICIAKVRHTLLRSFTLQFLLRTA